MPVPVLHSTSPVDEALPPLQPHALETDLPRQDLDPLDEFLHRTEVEHDGAALDPWRSVSSVRRILLNQGQSLPDETASRKRRIGQTSMPSGVTSGRGPVKTRTRRTSFGRSAIARNPDVSADE